MSDKAVLSELAHRVKVQRLNAGLAQSDVALKAGISRRALVNLEGSGVCTLALLIKVLRVIGQINQLEGLLPEPGLSPIQLAKLKGHERQRAFAPRRRHKPRNE
ncbi:MAG TPA: helix-turn-helix transcriptional regulator [Verrucomicrobiae bacterium]|nr:helix-turn-helix transcriptional regulator [Verrucomicrobiae bacterium]